MGFKSAIVQSTRKKINFNAMEEERVFYLTPKKLKEVKKECESLKKAKFAKTHSEVPNIWESEDLNPDYISFQEDLDLLEARISELENVIKNTKVIKSPPKSRKDCVDLGAFVTVEVNGQEDEFQILGTMEANPEAGKISSDSPVGRALLGAKQGEQVSVSSPIETVYKIKKIKYKTS
jgi:transcription elongation factor GreA